MNDKEFARNLAAGTCGLIVLHLLRDGPGYGYGIVKRVFEKSHGTVRWQEGTLYPVLHRLEKEGLVTSAWTASGNRRRRSYRLTARGRRATREQRALWRAFRRSVDLLLGL